MHKVLQVLICLAATFCGNIMAQTSPLYSYAAEGAAEVWIPHNGDTLPLFEQRVSVCMDDLRMFFFLKQLQPRAQVSVLGTDINTGGMILATNKSPVSDGFSITFYGPAERSRLGLPASFLYDSNSRTLYAPRLEMSREWFCSILLHELGHVNFDISLHAESARSAQLSRAWIEEEIAAYDFEREALDHYTKGAYTKTLNEILDKYKPESFNQLTSNIEKEDLDRLDRLFATKASALERGIRGPAFMFNLSKLLADRQKADPVEYFIQTVEYFQR